MRRHDFRFDDIRVYDAPPATLLERASRSHPGKLETGALLNLSQGSTPTTLLPGADRPHPDIDSKQAHTVLKADALVRQSAVRRNPLLAWALVGMWVHRREPVSAVEPLGSDEMRRLVAGGAAADRRVRQRQQGCLGGRWCTSAERAPPRGMGEGHSGVGLVVAALHASDLRFRAWSRPP